MMLPQPKHQNERNNNNKENAMKNQLNLLLKPMTITTESMVESLHCLNIHENISLSLVISRLLCNMAQAD